jgi:hypothetical protein
MLYGLTATLLAAGLIESAAGAEVDATSTAQDADLLDMIRVLQERVTQAELENQRLAARVAELEQTTVDASAPAQAAEAPPEDAPASGIETDPVDVLATSGYDGPAFIGAAGNGYFIRSEDGDYRLTAGGYLQTRYVYNHVADDGSGNSADDSGFTIPRARLWFGGKAFGDWGYFVRGDFRGIASQAVGETDPAFTTVGGRFQLDSYFLSYGTLFDTFSFKIGQFPSNLHREQFTEPHAKATQDNSPMATVFDTAVFQGIEFNWNPGRWRNTWVVSNGQRAVSRSFNDPRNAEIALSQHTEFFLAGDPIPAWMQLYSFTGRPGDEFVAKLGGSLHWEKGRESAPGVSFDILQAGAELSMEGDGWYTFARGDYWQTTWRSQGNPVDDWGFGLQGGFYPVRKHEVYGRIDGVFPDKEREDNGRFRTLTLGWTYYPIDGPGFENIKFGIETSYFFDPVAGSLVSPSNSLGLLASPEGDQFAISAEVGLLW